MILTLVLLAQVAAATPAAIPAPVRPKFTGGFGKPAAATAQKVVIADLPMATPPPPYSPKTPPGCETGSYKGKLDSVVNRFESDLKIARQTPRMSLAAQISRLQDIKRELGTLGGPPCASAVNEAALAWMDATIRYLTLFLGKDEGLSVAVQTEADAAFYRYKAERYYLP